MTESIARKAGRRAALITTLVVLASALPAGGVFAGDPNGADSSCTKSDTLSKRLAFASLHTEQWVLGRADAWAVQLSDFDMGVRQLTTEPTDLSEFLDFASGNAVAWTTEERAAWQPIIDKLSRAAAELNIDLPNIRFVRTSGHEEFNSAYTRGRAINMGPFEAALAVDAPDIAFFLLAHELFHALSREDSKLRDDMHALLGFTSFRNFDYPAEFEGRRLSNPDSFDYGAALTVQTDNGSADVVPIIQVRVPLGEAIQLPDLFAAVGIDLVAVDVSTGEAIRDGNGDVVLDGFDNTNWIPLMARNSDFIIQPQEVMADNFALLMQWRADGVLPATLPDGFPVNDVGLLMSIEDRLQAGCRTPPGHLNKTSGEATTYPSGGTADGARRASFRLIQSFRPR